MRGELVSVDLVILFKTSSRNFVLPLVKREILRRETNHVRSGHMPERCMREIVSLPGNVRKNLPKEVTSEPYVRTDKADLSLERRHREKRHSRRRCWGPTV